MGIPAGAESESGLSSVSAGTTGSKGKRWRGSRGGKKHRKKSPPTTQLRRSAQRSPAVGDRKVPLKPSRSPVGETLSEEPLDHEPGDAGASSGIPGAGEFPATS